LDFSGHTNSDHSTDTNIFGGNEKTLYQRIDMKKNRVFRKNTCIQEIW